MKGEESRRSREEEGRRERRRGKEKGRMSVRRMKEVKEVLGKTMQWEVL